MEFIKKIINTIKRQNNYRSVEGCCNCKHVKGNKRSKLECHVNPNFHFEVEGSGMCNKREDIK